MDRSNDSFAIVAAIFILFLVFNLYRSRVDAQAASPLGNPQEFPENSNEYLDISAPYTEYTLTQGPHGQSYGHLAIDLAAGKGTNIHSPINGNVTAVYFDEYDNPTLVIENDIYQVMLLHGVYIVQPGQRLQLGEVVGTESNLGYTTDMSGRPCTGRDCGYHTHMNIFDKRIGENVNPLLLLGLE